MESCETGRVRDLLCKNILRKVHSAVWHLTLFGFYFFGQVRLGFSLVKSFAEDSVPCFISVCLGWGGGWEEEGLLCVSSLRISVVLVSPFVLCFWSCLLGPLGIGWFLFKVFFFLFIFTVFCLELGLIGGEPAHFRSHSLQFSVPIFHFLYCRKGLDKQTMRTCLWLPMFQML